MRHRPPDWPTACDSFMSMKSQNRGTFFKYLLIVVDESVMHHQRGKVSSVCLAFSYLLSPPHPEHGLEPAERTETHLVCPNRNNTAWELHWE